MIKIELLSTENFNLDSLDHYPRKQDVKKVYSCRLRLYRRLGFGKETFCGKGYQQ